MPQKDAGDGEQLPSVEEIRARLAEMHQRVEERRAELIEPEFEHWRQRPYGGVPTPRLDSRIADATEQARQALLESARFEQRAAAREAP